MATPPAPPPVLTEPAIESARQLIGAGDFGRAEADLRAYLKDHEQSAEGRFLLAYALLRLDKPKESLSEYTRAAQLRMPSAADLKNVALDYVLLNDYGRWRSTARIPMRGMGWGGFDTQKTASRTRWNASRRRWRWSRAA